MKRYLAFSVLGLGCVSSGARADEIPGWAWHVGHSYSSVSALRQPATFVLSSDLGRPTLTVLDVGGLLSGPVGLHSGIDLGARYAGGSGRSQSRRVFDATLRGWHRSERLIVATNAGFETDGGFDVQKGTLGAEATITHGPRGLGQPWSPTVRIRWRPWIGVARGTVFATNDKSSDGEQGGFWRGHARLELHYAAGADANPSAELDVEAAGWLIFDDSRSEGFVKTALTVPLARGLSITASADAGREPPRFELARRLGLGIGYRH